jgi:hypothetical protein
MDSIAQFPAAFRRALPLWLKNRLSGGMNFVKAKRILTGLPDDRKNFSHPQAPRDRKIFPPTFAFQILDQL